MEQTGLLIQKLKRKGFTMSEKTVSVKILSGNMGDGWQDDKEAAAGYAAWIEANYPECEAEVVSASGHGGGVWDADGNDVATDPRYCDMWDKWCASEESKKYWAE